MILVVLRIETLWVSCGLYQDAAISLALPTMISIMNLMGHGLKNTKEFEKLRLSSILSLVLKFIC